MPKHLPGGKTRKTPKAKRPAPSAAAHRPARIEAPASQLPTTPAEAPAPPAVTSQSAAPSTASLGSRPSLLASVRRAQPRRTGPALITDYSYVLHDLRRIGIVAAVAVALLVALTFVIR